MEERITKQQLMKMYNVNRTTIEEWRKKSKSKKINMKAKEELFSELFNDINPSGFSFT